MDELAADKVDIAPGIYFGFARLNSVTYQTVISVGWNPFYKNTVKTIEAHLLATMDDFYGEHLEVLMCGFLREELNFSGLGRHIAKYYVYSSKRLLISYALSDDLISCIQTDIAKSKDKLDGVLVRYREQDSWSEFA